MELWTVSLFAQLMSVFILEKKILIYNYYMTEEMTAVKYYQIEIIQMASAFVFFSFHLF